MGLAHLVLCVNNRGFSIFVYEKFLLIMKGNNQSIKALIVFLVLLMGLLLLPDAHLAAQCAMCKASAESSVANGSRSVAGINHGILYLLIMPYALVAIIGIVWWRSRRKLAHL